MKKIFALVFALALLLPMGLIPVAKAEGEVTVQPFYVLSWSDMNNQQYPYLDGLVQANFNNIGDKATLSYGGSKIFAGNITDEAVDKFCQALKKTMDERPAGMRYLHLFGPAKILKLSPKNIIYLDHGVDQMKDVTSAFLKRYKEIGGLLDGLVIDTEYIGLSNHYINNQNDRNNNNAVNNPLIYKQIVDDPRYLTEVRPLLEERGFKFWTAITDYTPEIYSINKSNRGEEYTLCRSIWDTVMRIRLNRYVDEWAYAPLKEYFPQASLSDYQSTDSYAWLKLNAVTDDGVTLTGGNTVRAGTASCFSFYYNRPSSSFYKDMDKYASFNDAIYEGSPYNTLLYNTNYAKQMYAATDTKQIAPWITSYVYNDKKTGTLARTPYYSEQLFHLGLLDPEPFLSYTYRNEYDDVEWPLTQQIMNEVMAELTRVAGYSDRKPIQTDVYWNTEFILSGMYANGRNIWRITPNADEISLADFKIAGDDPTFSVKGRTVTFPGGKIIEDTPISTAGTNGYWVETAADMMPVITHDPNRYAKYPSLLENFEGYQPGKFDNVTAQPATTWDITPDAKKGGTANIVAAGNGQALAVTGDMNIRHVRMPAKITAGDSYAEDQVWEVTVTIPEGLSAEAQISLLRYTGTQMPNDTSGFKVDCGFKIAGGKVYYTVLGQADEKGNIPVETKELADISAGTYTFRRVMNLNDAKNYKASYYVLDTNGTELASIADVSAPTFATINAITFVSQNVDKAVLLDDYKLYPTGIAADFELYDATFGTNVVGEAKESPRAASTAYRLSWLNGTDKEEYLTVMAAVYQDGVLVEQKAVKEVKMLPGCDAVDTGVVEVAAGQSIHVYLKHGRHNPSEEKTPLNLTLIIPIAAAVVAVLVAAAALLATKSSKKASAPAETEQSKNEE